ncbi:MAG: hypothetical protein GDA49_08350 [Rhodospirillales bacterium]|nr:hypothetical protein [Rhodospirillales bacterium]
MGREHVVRPDRPHRHEGLTAVVTGRLPTAVPGRFGLDDVNAPRQERQRHMQAMGQGLGFKGNAVTHYHRVVIAVFRLEDMGLGSVVECCRDGWESGSTAPPRHGP